MNRKERRAEAKQMHQASIVNSNSNQEESMNEMCQVGVAPNANAITTTKEEAMIEITSEAQTKSDSVGFFSRIKNAFIAGYRAGKAGIKEQVHEIQDTYVSVLEENKNPVVAHTKAVVKTTFLILKKTLKGLFSLIALPFIKIDSFIDRKEEVLS